MKGEKCFLEHKGIGVIVELQFISSYPINRNSNLLCSGLNKLQREASSDILLMKQMVNLSNEYIRMLWHNTALYCFSETILFILYLILLL